MNAEDQIDGGAGEDTLKVNLESSFAGFTADKGFLKNVENVELNNTTGIARDFNAKAITGVKNYTLNSKGGVVSLTDLAEAGQTITVNEQAGATNLNVAFATGSAVVTGTSDALTLSLNKVGTEETKANAGDQKYVTANIANIEALTINSNGEQTNFVNLSGVTGAKSLTVAGQAGLNVQAVAAALETVDAAAAAEKVTANLTAATALKSVATGAGDDSITLNAENVLANAAVAGGAGNDKVVINATGAATLQFAMTGVETLEVGTIGGDLTYSAKNTTGLTSVDIASTVASNATLAALGSGDLTVNLKGANGKNNVLQADSSGALTVNTVATAKAITDKTGQLNTFDVTATKATSVLVNVGQFTTYNGDIIASEATEVTVKAGSSLNATKVEQSGFGGTITANKASSFAIESLGTIGGTVTAGAATSATVVTGGTAGTLAIVAGKLEKLTVTAGNTLDIDKGATLTKLQDLNATVAKGTLTVGDLAAASSVTVGGAGATSAADIGDLGSNTLEYGLTVNASGLKTGLQLDTLTSRDGNVVLNAAEVTGSVTQVGAVAGKSVTVNVDGTGGAVQTGAITADSVTIAATGALSTVVIGDGAGSAAADITAKNSVTYNGAALAENKADIVAGVGSTALTVNLAGGIKDDAFTITGVTTSTSIKVSGALDIGTNSVTIDGKAATAALTIDASGVSGDGTTTVKIDGSTAAANTITGSATAANTIFGGNVADTIKGGAGADIISGGKGADILTGGAGADTFVVADLTDSLLAAFDKITDFAIGTDSIKSKAVAASDVVELGAVATLDSAGIGVVLTAAAFLGDKAATFTFVDTGTTRTFVAINDDTDGFDASTDAIIEITGYTGALTDLAIIA